MQVGGTPDGARRTHESVWKVPKAVARICTTVVWGHRPDSRTIGTIEVDALTVKAMRWASARF